MPEYERYVCPALNASDGLQIVDFLSGYCVHNMSGHNHTYLIQAAKRGTSTAAVR